MKSGPLRLDGPVKCMLSEILLMRTLNCPNTQSFHRAVFLLEMVVVVRRSR